MKQNTQVGRSRKQFVAFAALAVMLCASQSVSAQSIPAPRSQVFVLKTPSGDRKAGAIMQEATATWQAEFQQLRNRKKLGAFVQAITSLGQQVDVAATWLGSRTDTQQQIRDAFRREVVDERKLLTRMREYAARTLANLPQQDRQPRTPGQPIATEAALLSSGINTSSWNRAFDPLFQQAVQMSQDHTVKSLGIFAGTNVLGDAINDAGRAIGVNPYEEGSTGDLLADLIVNVAVGFAVDAAFDPTERLCNELETELRRVEQTLLHGPQGLLRQLRTAVEKHQ